MKPLLASIKKGAEVIDVARPVMRRLIREGRIRAVQIPGVSRILIPFEELERFAREECIPVKGPIRPARPGKRKSA